MSVLRENIVIQPSPELNYELSVRTWLHGVKKRLKIPRNSRWVFNRILSSFFCTRYTSERERAEAYERMRKDMATSTKNRSPNNCKSYVSALPETFSINSFYNVSRVELTKDLAVVVYMENGKVVNMGPLSFAKKSIPRFFEYYSSGGRNVALQDLAKIAIAYDNMFPDSPNFWSPIRAHALAKQARESGKFCVECFSGPYDRGDFLNSEDGEVYGAAMYAHPFCKALTSAEQAFPHGLGKFQYTEKLFLEINPPHVERIVEETIKSLVEFLKKRPPGTTTTGVLLIPQYVDLYDDPEKLGTYLGQLDYDIELEDHFIMSNFNSVHKKEIPLNKYILHFRGLLPTGQFRKWDAEEPKGSRDAEGKWLPFLERELPAEP